MQRPHGSQNQFLILQMPASLLWSLILTLALTVSCTSSLKPATPVPSENRLESVGMVDGGYPVMQGVTGTSWTRLTILRPKKDELTYKIINSEGQIAKASNLRQSTHEFVASDAVVDELTIQGLIPDEQMTLIIEKNISKDSAKSGVKDASQKAEQHDRQIVGQNDRQIVGQNDRQIVDERRFRSRATGRRLRFAVASCSDDSYVSEQKVMWSHLLAQKPDVIFSIGDNVYADWADGKYQGDASPELIWRRYVETRRNLALFRARDLVPVVATWDDHDFGQNDGDRRFVHQKAAEQIFNSFYPQKIEREMFVQGPGVASGLSWGEQRFLLLDGRSFRSPNKAPSICQVKTEAKACQPRPQKDRGPDPLAKKEPETHFGHLQTQWALKQVEAAGSDVVWLISGDQWFGSYSPFESFESNHPKDFQKFLKAIKDQGGRVAFVSGDRHSSELSRIDKKYLGYETLEIVSSPIHAKVFPSNWIEFPNPRQIVGVSEAFNYTLVESEVQDQKWSIATRNYKLDPKTSKLSLGFENNLVIERPIAE